MNTDYTLYEPGRFRPTSRGDVSSLDGDQSMNPYDDLRAADEATPYQDGYYKGQGLVRDTIHRTRGLDRGFLIALAAMCVTTAVRDGKRRNVGPLLAHKGVLLLLSGGLLAAYVEATTRYMPANAAADHRAVPFWIAALSTVGLYILFGIVVWVTFNTFVAVVVSIPYTIKRMIDNHRNGYHLTYNEYEVKRKQTSWFNRLRDDLAINAEDRAKIMNSKLFTRSVDNCTRDPWISCYGRDGDKGDWRRDMREGRNYFKR